MYRERPKQLQNVSGLIITLGVIVIGMVVAALAGAFGLNILDSVDNTFTANSAEANFSDDFKVGAANLSSQIPNVGLVIGGGLVLLILIGVFSFALGRRR